MHVVSKLRPFGIGLVLAALLSGCSVSGSFHWTITYHNVYGIVRFGPLHVPLVNAEVYFYDGPVDRRVVTDPYGRYTVSLPAGSYKVLVRSLHGDYRDIVHVSGTMAFDIHVPAGWYQHELFLALAGIKRYDVQYGQIGWQYGQSVRWDQSRIRIYYDSLSVPPYIPQAWPSHLTSVIQSWSGLLGHRIRFEAANSQLDAHVIVRIEPHGSLGPDVAAVHSQMSYNGRLEQVTLWIDASYVGDRDLWEHEWAHAMGVYHSNDPYSVLYPAVVYGQRKTLTDSEKRHIQLLYDLPPGLAMYGYGAFETQGITAAQVTEGEPASELVVSESGMVYSGHRRLVDGTTLPLTEYEAESLFVD